MYSNSTIWGTHNAIKGKFEAIQNYINDSLSIDIYFNKDSNKDQNDLNETLADIDREIEDGIVLVVEAKEQGQNMEDGLNKRKYAQEALEKALFKASSGSKIETDFGPVLADLKAFKELSQEVLKIQKQTNQVQKLGRTNGKTDYIIGVLRRSIKHYSGNIVSKDSSFRIIKDTEYTNEYVMEIYEGPTIKFKSSSRLNRILEHCYWFQYVGKDIAEAFKMGYWYDDDSCLSVHYYINTRQPGKITKDKIAYRATEKCTKLKEERSANAKV